MFSIMTLNELILFIYYEFYLQITPNLVKLGRAVTFMKYLADVVCLISTKNFNLQ